MTREPETLTELVAARVGVPGGMTYRRAEELVADSGYGVSRGVIFKIAKGQTIIVSPEVVRAVAYVLGLPEQRVQEAAAYQYTGLVPTEVAGGLVLHDPAAGGDTPGSERAVRQQRERERDAEG